MMVLFFIVMSTIFQCCFSAASFPLARQEQSNRTMAANDPLGPYIVLPIEGHKFTGNDGYVSGFLESWKCMEFSLFHFVTFLIWLLRTISGHFCMHASMELSFCCILQEIL